MLVIIDVVDIRSATWFNSLTRIGQEQQHIARLDPWPAYSPDLNPIEHCWDQVGRVVRQRVLPGDTLHDLRRYLQDAWDAVTPERIARLIRSMRRRCVACIAARGGHTRYRVSMKSQSL